MDREKKEKKIKVKNKCKTKQKQREISKWLSLEKKTKNKKIKRGE